MADPIEAHYTPDGDDWTVAVKGRGQTLTGRAPGLIAARDRADELAEQLAPQEPGRRTVVHMLNGDALEFTEAYLTARLARTDEPAVADNEPTDRPTNEATTTDEGDAGEADLPSPATSAEGQPPVVTKPTPAPRTESQAAQPSAKPAETATPAEETAPSGS
jgi:hypothetical protein